MFGAGDILVELRFEFFQQQYHAAKHLLSEKEAGDANPSGEIEDQDSSLLYFETPLLDY